MTKAQIVKLLDPQMLEVVTLLNQIRGTPILKLTPQDARQQFGAEDAAKILERRAAGNGASGAFRYSTETTMALA